LRITSEVKSGMPEKSEKEFCERLRERQSGWRWASMKDERSLDDLSTSSKKWDLWSEGAWDRDQTVAGGEGERVIGNRAGREVGNVRSIPLNGQIQKVGALNERQ
jgi:hypothetical protein